MLLLIQLFFASTTSGYSPEDAFPSMAAGPAPPPPPPSFRFAKVKKITENNSG